MKTYVIGAGGVGSFLVPVLCKLIGSDNVAVMDGDKLERKNLDRQLYDESDIGRFKCQALAERYNCEGISEWFSFGSRPYERGDVLIACVDNHAARMAVLETCDYHKCVAILAANETHSASADFYHPDWKSTNLDPRVMFPEMTTDLSGDPRRAAIGCTGEAQETNRQLVTANFLAAALAGHLFVVWCQEARKMPKESREHLPHRLSQTLSRSESFKAQVLNPVS